MKDWQEKLQEAKDLLEIGIISEADYQELKADFLGKQGIQNTNGLPAEDTIPSEIIDKVEDLSHLNMVLISAGTFWMGVETKDEAYYASPRHQVEITKDFYVGKYLVTQALWKKVMGNNPSHVKGDTLPLESVEWLDCIRFCNQLSKQENRMSVYTIRGKKISCNWNADGYRLLTEAEWEYTARAGEEYIFAGSNDLDEVAWHGRNSADATHPVGQKKPNGFGLYDMSGNVFEWVWDWADSYDDPEYKNRAGKLTVDPRGPVTKHSKCVRSFAAFYRDLRGSHLASRSFAGFPNSSRSDIGFRIARNA